MLQPKKENQLVIKKELLETFCKKNDFIIITDDMLKEHNMYKNIVYATDNNFVNESVYPKDMRFVV